MGFLKLNTNSEYALALVAVFVGIFLLASGLFHLVLRPLLWKRDLNRRLLGHRARVQRVQILKAVVQADKSVVLLFVERLVGWGKIENLRRKLLQADIFWTPATFLSVCGILASVGLMAGLLRDKLLVGLVLAAALGWAPVFYLNLKRNQKTKKFETQMPEGMELLARSLRAGHTLPSAIDLGSREIAAPLGTEMKVVYEEQRLGLSLQNALQRMGERVDSQDLQYFITAVTLQAETGGNLAEVMENIGYLIRERLKLKGKIKAITAEGRFSALILSLLPVGLFVVLLYLNPKYVQPFFEEPVGAKMLAAGGLGILTGYLWMQRLIKIKV